jgi:hypothetical protein
MKRKIVAQLILFAVASFCALALVVPARAAALSSVKLPYTKGESFIVSQGYNSLPTHIKKDAYALDFTQNGCDAYGKAVVAAASGTAMFVGEEGYNGGYGTELIIDHGDNIVSRYAHMIPDSVAVAQNDHIRQGETVGYVGDTGLVAGAACANHPGTHLHFAMDTVAADGTFTAYDPEPISGYTDITEEQWYISDNGEDDTESADTFSADTSDPVGDILGAYDNASDETSSITATPPATATTITVPAIADATITTPIVLSPVAAPIVIPAAVGENIPTGGVSAISPDPASTQSPIPVVAPVPVPAPLPSPSSGSDSSSTGTSETVSASSTTTVPDATSTLESSTTSATSSTTTTTSSATSTPTTTISTPDASPTSTPALFAQTADTAQSPQSWYDDNWFDLGNGYAGTLNTLTLEGKVSDVHYFASHVWLQEFKDPNYTAMIQQFTISDNAPFTNVMATATFSGLAIPLKPYFYYRLATVQDYQNRSVILAGTPNTTVGTVMWDSFIYGTGRVESTNPYFPYMIMEGVAATSTEMPPPLPPPSDMIIDFDDVGMQLTPSFSISTDPDWPANPLHFEMNYSTSSSLSDAGWGPLAPIPLVFGNSYLIGVRERDNFGDVSAPATTTWNFPAGFSPYILSPEMSYAAQYFNVSVTSTLQSIALFTTNLQTGARFPTGIWCTLSLYDSYNQASYGNTPSDNTISGYGCAGNPVFSFASSPLVLSPSHHYQWIFHAQTGNESTNASVQFYGTMIDTAGGLFNNSSLVNARFIVNGGSGVLFSN